MFAGPCDDWANASSSYQAALNDALAQGNVRLAEQVADMLAHYARVFTITWMLRLAEELQLLYMVDSQTMSDDVYGMVEIPDPGGAVSAIYMLSLVVDRRAIIAISPAWKDEDGTIHPLTTYAEARQAAIENIITPIQEVSEEYGLPGRGLPL